MQPRVLKFFADLRSSYWFVPAVMAVAAVILGAGTIYVDTLAGPDFLNGLSWYQRNKPDGARAVLSTIAGSAITVAGVVFSITIVAVSYAASQYGPRVLTNFMSDRGNQFTLGTFTATYLYCLVVLRTIRSGEEGAFVPDLGVLIALLLALCSIGVLIFFIHHVPRSIHVNTVVAGIGRDLIESLEDRFPQFIGDAPGKSEIGEQDVPAPLRSDGLDPAADVMPVRSMASGYIEAIDDDELMEVAHGSGLVLRMQCQPGDFIHVGRTFALVWPSHNLTGECLKDLQRTFAVSNRRTPLQDTRFLMDELVEVGTRALSPGVNDPFTAMTCLDWLGAALSEAARRRLPSPYRVDGEGALRVIARPMSFECYVERGFGQFRQYLATDRNACLHTLKTIEQIAAACISRDQVKRLLEEVDALRLAAGQALAPTLSAEVQEAARETRVKLDEAAGRRRPRD